MAVGALSLTLFVLAALGGPSDAFFRHKQFPVVVMNGCSSQHHNAVGTDGSLLIRRSTSPFRHTQTFCEVHHLTVSECSTVRNIVLETLLSTARADESNWILTMDARGEGPLTVQVGECEDIFAIMCASSNFKRSTLCIVRQSFAMVGDVGTESAVPVRQGRLQQSRFRIFYSLIRRYMRHCASCDE